MLAALTGCAEPELELPTAVHSALSAEDTELLVKVVAHWHAALGVDVVTRVDRATTGCGIFVRYSDLRPEIVGVAKVPEPCVGTIRIRPQLGGQMTVLTLAHELGHIFQANNYEHSTDPHSLMFPTLDPRTWQDVTDEDVAVVLRRMGL